MTTSARSRKALLLPPFVSQTPRPLNRRGAILRNLIFFGVLLAVSLFISQQAHAAPSKQDTLRGLRDWRTRLINQDDKTSSTQKKLITSIAATGKIAELEAPLDEITKLDDERSELEARRRIVDQIIFAVDTKWSGADLRGFLEAQLLDLAVTDLSEPRQGGWWRFLIQAAVSLKEVAEPGADPIKFLEVYMAQSGVLEPKSAVEVSKTRNYIGD